MALQPSQVILFNASKTVSNSEVALMAAAVSEQVRQHFAPAWGMAPVPVVSLDKASPLPAGSAAIYLLDDPDEPNALGYHTEQGGIEYGRIFARPVLIDGNGVVLCDPKNGQRPSVASVLSHEVLELLGDPSCNEWVDGRHTRHGSEYSREVCDPVEADQYTISVSGTPVAVSDFVTPSWFDIQADPAERFDQLGILSGPFSLSRGGYLVVRSAKSAEHQLFGREYAQWRHKLKSHPQSRRSRRTAK